jgi:hypothetical protein
MNEITNCLSSKMPSRLARMPPKTEGGHHGDRQVWLQRHRHRRLQHDAEHDADDHREHGEHQ